MPRRRDAALSTLLASDERAYAVLLADAFARGAADLATLDALAKEYEEGTPVRKEAAATLLAAWLAKAPWNGDVAYRLATVLTERSEAAAQAAFHRAHLAFALDHLQNARTADARRSWKLALRYGDGAEAKLVEALCDAVEANAPLAADAIARWTDCETTFRERVLLLDANPALGPAVAALSRKG